MCKIFIRFIIQFTFEKNIKYCRCKLKSIKLIQIFPVEVGSFSRSYLLVRDLTNDNDIVYSVGKSLTKESDC